MHSARASRFSFDSRQTNDEGVGEKKDLSGTKAKMDIAILGCVPFRKTTSHEAFEILYRQGFRRVFAEAGRELSRPDFRPTKSLPLLLTVHKYSVRSLSPQPLNRAIIGPMAHFAHA